MAPDLYTEHGPSVSVELFRYLHRPEGDPTSSGKSCGYHDPQYTENSRPGHAPVVQDVSRKEASRSEFLRFHAPARLFLRQGKPQLCRFA